MGKPCPVCGKGMFRQRRLKRHIRQHHPTHYLTHIYTGESRADEHRKKEMREMSTKKKDERLKKVGLKPVKNEKEG